MAIVEYSSTISPLPLSTLVTTVNYIDTYPNGDYAPAVRVYSTKSTQSTTTDGRWTRHKSRDSVRTPNYRFLVSKGLPLPFNDFSYSERTNRDWVGYTSSVTIPNTQGTSSSEFRVGSFDLATTTLAEGITATGCQGLLSALDRSRIGDRALTQVISRIRNQKIDVGVALGEHKQTMRLVADNAKRIAQSLLHLKRGDFRAAANQFGAGVPTRARRRFDRDYVGRDRPKAISRAWLELQYGWKPLLSDIYGACSQLAEQPRAAYEQVSGKSSMNATIAGTYGETANRRFSESGQQTYSVKYVIRFATPRPGLQDLGRLGVLNPATVAWELMPWSFVIDWFLPIGNWLGSFNYEMGLSFIDGSITTFNKIESAATATTFGSTPTRTLSGNQVKNIKVLVVSRAKIFSFPSVPYPTFKNPVSRGHMFNALALLVQLRK